MVEKDGFERKTFVFRLGAGHKRFFFFFGRMLLDVSL